MIYLGQLNKKTKKKLLNPLLEIVVSFYHSIIIQLGLGKLDIDG